MTDDSSRAGDGEPIGRPDERDRPEAPCHARHPGRPTWLAADAVPAGPSDGVPVPRRSSKRDRAPSRLATEIPHRPRIVDEPGILGLSRVARSRFGSRLFKLFFVFVFALILVQMIVALMTY